MHYEKTIVWTQAFASIEGHLMQNMYLVLVQTIPMGLASKASFSPRLLCLSFFSFLPPDLTEIWRLLNT